jgi:hypothetical protein
MSPLVWIVKPAGAGGGLAQTEVIGQRQVLGSRVQWRDLNEVPVAKQVLHVVVELDVGLQDLSGPWIADVRPRRVFDIGSKPADHRIPRVLRTPFGVYLFRWRFARDDGVAEPGRFEGRLPILDALLDVFDPLGRRRRIDVVRDGFDRVGNIRRGILLLQSPSRDVATFGHAVFGGSEVILRNRKVPYAIVE